VRACLTAPPHDAKQVDERGVRQAHFRVSIRIQYRCGDAAAHCRPLLDGGSGPRQQVDGCGFLRHTGVRFVLGPSPERVQVPILPQGTAPKKGLKQVIRDSELACDSSARHPTCGHVIVGAADFIPDPRRNAAACLVVAAEHRRGVPAGGGARRRLQVVHEERQRDRCERQGDGWAVGGPLADRVERTALRRLQQLADLRRAGAGGGPTRLRWWLRLRQREPHDR
jgi:hypothetical protein